MDEDLPPLPEPYHGFYAAPMYSADQMRAYALAALAQPANIAEWWAAKQAASGEQATAWTCNCPACGARLFCSCAARRKR